MIELKDASELKSEREIVATMIEREMICAEKIHRFSKDMPFTRERQEFTGLGFYLYLRAKVVFESVAFFFFLLFMCTWLFLFC